MGANQSGGNSNSKGPSNPDEIRSMYKLEEQNKLLQEKLKNQELQKLNPKYLMH